MQLIALDSTAQQALGFLDAPKFDSIVETSIEKLSSKMIDGYRPILLLSQLDSTTVSPLIAELERCTDPVIILPDVYRESREMKQLLTVGVRVILSKTVRGWIGIYRTKSPQTTRRRRVQYCWRTRS